MYNNNKNKLRELTLMGMMVALLEVVKVALMLLPNIELVSLFIVLFTLFLGKKVLLVVMAFSLLECLIWGFGIWSIGYFYIWPILVIVTLVLKKHSSSLVWAIVLGFFGLFFGGFFAITTLITSGIEAAIAYWISGLLFDIIHCVSNFFIALVLFKPLNNVLKQLIKV